MRVYIENNFPKLTAMSEQVFERVLEGNDTCQFVFETKAQAKSFALDTDFRLVDLENGHWGVRAK